MRNSTTACYNTALGFGAGLQITTGNCNVVIGNQVAVAVSTGSCQLAIGFGTNAYWLTGDSTKAIKPGAGIIDCAGSCGTNGQVLQSNGSNAIVWAVPTAPSKGYLAARGAGQSFTNSLLTALTLSVYQSSGITSASSCICVISGKKYLISAGLGFSNLSLNAADGYLPYYIMCAGTNVVPTGMTGILPLPGSTAFTTNGTLNGIFAASANGYIQLCAGFVGTPGFTGTINASSTYLTMQEL